MHGRKEGKKVRKKAREGGRKRMKERRRKKARRDGGKERKDNMWYIHTMAYYSAIKNRKSLYVQQG